MWITKRLFELVLDDNKRLTDEVVLRVGLWKESTGRNSELHIQKAKDDLTIDWMRHRVNALEKQNAIMLAKIAGVHFPTPEIVPSRPNTLEANYDHLPSFEDLGESEATRLGIEHDENGALKFTK